MYTARNKTTPTNLYIYILLNYTKRTHRIWEIGNQFDVTQVSIVTYFLYSLSKKLEFAYAASTMTTIHSDRLVLASYDPWPVIQPLESQGQIVSSDFP